MIDRLSIKILKYINKHPNQPLRDLEQKFGENAADALNHLAKNSYIINETKGYYPVTNGVTRISSNMFRISPLGRAYLQSRKDDAVKYWIPIIISNLIAVAALIVSILK